MAPPQVPGLNIPLLEGPLVLGYLWSYMLYGVLIVQMYIYYMHFTKDHKGIKIFEWTLFLLETVFTIFTTIAAWNQFGKNWGDVQSLLLIDWSWEPLPALNGFLATMVQSFYVWRIYNLTKNIFIALFIESVSLMQCILAFFYGIRVSVEGRGIDKLFALTNVISAWLVGAAVCDVLITVTIVTVLARANQRTRFKQTTNAITRLIRYTVETGLITSVMAVIELILWLTTGKEYNIHFIGFLVLGKLYSNALVATLNSRASIFGDPQAYKAQASSVPQTSSAFWDDTRSKNAAPASVPLRSHGVHVSRTTEMNTDHGMVIVSELKNDGLVGSHQSKYAQDF